MSVLVISAVFRASKSKGAARLVLLALADVAADDGSVTAYRRSQSILAAKANINPGTVPRAIDQLVELGEVVVLNVGDGRTSSDYRIALDGIEGAQDEGARDARPARAERAPRARRTRTQGAPDARPIIPSLDVDDPSSTSSAPDGAGEVDAARDLVTAFWQWCEQNGKPKPTLRAVGGRGPDRAFVSLVGIVRTLLDAGHEAKAVKVALTKARAYTIDSITFALNDSKASPLGPGATGIAESWAGATPPIRKGQR